jgi:nitroreductase
MTNAILDLLATRRSVKPAALAEPGPNPAQLEQILTIAARVPDHKKIEPWRFVVFEGEARARFGAAIAEACKAEDKMAPSEARLETERARLLRAPTVVAVISRIVETPGAPEIEQILSCGAVCQNLCLAANAMGFGTCWITEWIAFSPRVKAALGLAANERIAGFIYIGTAKERQPDRERPALAKIVSRWQG